MTAQDVLEAIATIPEPCSLLFGEPTNLRDMGLVETVELADAGVVHVTLVLTDPSCVHFGGMRTAIGEAVGALPGVRDVRVTMSTTQLWTEDRVRA